MSGRPCAPGRCRITSVEPSGLWRRMSSPLPDGTGTTCVVASTTTGRTGAKGGRDAVEGGRCSGDAGSARFSGDGRLAGPPGRIRSIPGADEGKDDGEAGNGGRANAGSGGAAAAGAETRGMLAAGVDGNGGRANAGSCGAVIAGAGVAVAGAGDGLRSTREGLEAGTCGVKPGARPTGGKVGVTSCGAVGAAWGMAGPTARPADLGTPSRGTGAEPAAAGKRAGAGAGTCIDEGRLRGDACPGRTPGCGRFASAAAGWGGVAPPGGSTPR